MYFSDVYECIDYVRSLKTSDVHLSVGFPTMFRIRGKLVSCEVPMSDDDITSLISAMMTAEQIEWFDTGEVLDFALKSPDGSRARVNVFSPKGQIGANSGT